jgi:hypothetical protein
LLFRLDLICGAIFSTDRPTTLPPRPICSQPRPPPPGIFILVDGIGLVAKRIEIIPSTTPLMVRISFENLAYGSYQRRIDEVHITGRMV